MANVDYKDVVYEKAIAVLMRLIQSAVHGEVVDAMEEENFDLAEAVRFMVEKTN